MACTTAARRAAQALTLGKALTLALAMALALSPGLALGHDPYTGLRNPSTDVPCCHNQDCRAVEQHEISDSGTSYVWRGARYPKAQTMQSPDSRYHVCARRIPWGGEWHIICLLRPTPGT